MLLSLDDGQQKPLVTDGANATVYTSLAFSPNGEALAFAGCTDSLGLQCRVGMVPVNADLQAGAVRWLTSEFEVVNGIAWTRDAESLVYGAASVWLNTFHLWQVPVRGGPAARLDLAGSATQPSIPVHSDRLIFTRRYFDLGVWRLARGGTIEPIVESTFADYDGNYAPDGSKISFVTDRRGEGSEVWTANADGTQLKALTRGVQRTRGSPRWSPDGQWIAFDGKSGDGHWYVFVVEAEGRSPRRLTTGTFTENFPSWSGDGKWVYFASSRTGEGVQDIWRASATGEGALERVTHGGGNSPLESPDARSLYFTRRSGSQATLFSMPLMPSGSPALEVLTGVYGWAYWPTPEGIYYVTRLGQAGSKPRYEVRLHGPRQQGDQVISSFAADYFQGCLSVFRGNILTSGAQSVNLDLMMIEKFK
jgi:tricorn protease-like protein